MTAGVCVDTHSYTYAKHDALARQHDTASVRIDSSLKNYFSDIKMPTTRLP